MRKEQTKPICEEYDGSKMWWLNGEHHREDGPAVECTDGYKEWWLNGELHREDGPAVEYASGDKEWWLNDKNYKEKDYWKELNSRGLIDDTELFEKLL